MINFHLIGKGLKRRISRKTKRRLSLEDLLEAHLLEAREAIKADTKDEKLSIGVTSATLDLSMDDEGFFSWMEPLIQRGYGGFLNTFKDVDLFFTSIEDGLFTIIEYKNDYLWATIFVLDEESTVITLNTLRGLYENLRGGVVM